MKSPEHKGERERQEGQPCVPRAIRVVLLGLSQPLMADPERSGKVEVQAG